MLTSLKKFIDTFVYSDKAVRLQVAFSLHTTHVLHAMRTYQDERVRRIYLDRFGELPQDKTMHELYQFQPSRWDWTGVPHMHWILLFQEIFTSLYFCYILFKILLRDYLERKLLIPWGLNPNYPLRCYTPGAFYVCSTRLVDETLAVVASLVHTIWRSIEFSHKQDMTMPYFMFLSQQDLDNYYERFIKRGSRKDLFHSDSNKQVAATTTTRAVADFEDALEDCFFHDILSYKMPITRQIQYIRLRPNRTREQIFRLRRIFANLFLFNAVIILTTAACVVPVIYVRVIDKLHYDTYLTDCGVDASYWLRLSDTSTRINIGGPFSLSIIDINWYRFIIFLFDVFDNAFCWYESGSSIFLGVQLVGMINYDLKTYMRAIHRNILQVYKYMKLNQDQLMRRYSMKTQRIQENSNLVVSADARMRRRHSTIIGPLNSLKQIEPSQLDQLIGELQHQIHDFFKQIERSDGYMSDVLTLTLMIWFSIFLAYVYVSILDQTNNALSVTTFTKGNLIVNNNYNYSGSSVRGNNISYSNHSNSINDGDDSPTNFLSLNVMIVIIPLIIVTLVCWSLLSLHHQSIATYKYLCSIVAMYQSDNKTSFLSVLNHFSEYRTCYTLFRMSPFMPITYLSIVGWSFSCVFILKSLLTGRGGHHGLAHAADANS